MRIRVGNRRGLLLAAGALVLLAVSALLVAVTAGTPRVRGGSAQAASVASAPGGAPADAPPSGTTGTVGAPGAGDPYYPTDGNGGYDVTAYDLALRYDPPSRQLSGEATISARALSPLSRFNLDLTGLEVSAVRVNDHPATFTREGDHELVIQPADLLPAGDFRVSVRYSGSPVTLDDALGRGGWQISASGGAFVAGQPHSATTWFPANDTPGDKAAFRIALDVPDGWSVVANGVPAGETSADGWTTHTWVEQTPMATYLSTVIIDRLSVVRSQLPDGTPVVDAYAPGAEGKKALADRLPEVLAFLSEKFGAYPQRAAGGIFLAEDISFSLETQTRPTYAQWTDLGTIVHENAHQWFGDSVSVSRWADICLNECLASYAEWLWAEGEDGTDLDARYRSQVRSHASDQRFWARRLVDMGAGHEFEGVYDKGVLAMHALRRQVGDQAFFTALRTWAAVHRDGNATWSEFESHLEQAAGQQLDGFFAAWFRAAEVPADEYLWPASLR
ncbi:M1 family metallopeptidase [Goodfellowiella coeruleoviolacea]|uniref:Aminopeptidase N n=1 Tax=Goodfellowiella coeruleoviolacea TaxID=334858 RepID=A0AAE3GCF1_9PSEU|nr:M1 family metallopeptidase [Goodfellowiella coeruleoviolacea]MCP2164697.1 Peptidase family M1 [Goodfellowiella coeruleoviolacea]